jgi:molybdopterin molybdotransferase
MRRVSAGAAHRWHYNTDPMIPVAQGQAHILARIVRPQAAEAVPVTRALGRVLGRDVPAPFDVPPADNSAVDGYAVRAADLVAGGRAQLRVAGDLAAGSTYDGRVAAGEAVRIMTGAPMPAGADTVVPQELAEREDGTVRLGAVAAGANVRGRGEDVRSGVVVLRHGTVLRPQELGLLASLGFHEAWVHARPRVALLSTGDEVVEPGRPRRPGQIYDANRFALHGLVEAAGGTVIDFGIVPDLHDVLRARLLEAAEAADVVITSGGVSVGVHDLVKQVLAEVGAIDFWQVAMQPGRPFAVGTIGDSLFFGLPGNPVASMLCFLLFVRPALWKLGGRTSPPSPRSR